MLDCTISFTVNIFFPSLKWAALSSLWDILLWILTSYSVSLEGSNPLPSYSKKWRRWRSLFEVIVFSFVHSEIQVNSCKAYTETPMNETLPVHITAADSSLLIIYAFSFWLQALWMLKCLCRIRTKGGLPSQENWNSQEFRIHNAHSPSFLLQVSTSLLNYIYAPVPQMPRALKPHLHHIFLSHCFHRK